MAVIRLRFNRTKRTKSVDNDSDSVQWFWALMDRSISTIERLHRTQRCGGYVYSNVILFHVMEESPYDAPALLVQIRVPKNAQEWEFTRLNLQEMGILLMRNIRDPEGSEYGSSEDTD
jgi:hypothetical protein